MGTATASVSAQIADVQRLVEKSGLKYIMHSAGTTLGSSSIHPVSTQNYLPPYHLHELAG